MSDLRQRIANLTPEQRALLEQRLQTASEPNGEAAIPRRGSTGPVRLSFAQERLWFLAQLYPQQSAYNEASAYRLRGRLDVDGLQGALTKIVERHAVLRTTFSLRDGIPWQQTADPGPVSLPVIDLSDRDLADPTAEARQRFAEVITPPFDLQRDLMFRARLYRLAAEDHILLTVRHHIASDAWSSRIFWQELAVLYAAAVSGRPDRLPELPIQYTDYAIWQREQLQGEQLRGQLDYWRRQLDGLPLLELPTDRPRPPLPGQRGAAETFRLAPEIAAGLQRLARSEKTTLYTVLLTALMILLSRISGQNDIAVGTPTANRNRAETERLIGFFVNTLVMRARLKGNPTFRQLLRRLRQTVLEAQEHQTIPFERVVERLQPERRLNRSPLIDIVFQFLELPEVEPALPGMVVEPVAVPDLNAKYDLDLSLRNGPDGLSGRWRYATDLFEPGTIRRMIARYQTLLAAIIQDPDCAVERLPILPVDERRRLMTAWNDTARSFPREIGVHELFRQQAAVRPEAVAVQAGGRRLTYGQLERRANRLAHRLQAHGVGAGTLVGIASDRSPELVVAVLAVFKAGGAYVPLDPEFPPERLALMLEDARPRVVLAAPELAGGSLTLPPESVLIGLDEAGSALDDWPDTPPTAPLSGADLAYVIYTSGSTGRPKGVQITHRSAVNLLCSLRAEPGFSTDDHLLAVTTFSFDMAFVELLLPLVSGGRLTVADRETVLDGVRLARTIDELGITVMQATPSGWRLLLDSGWAGRPKMRIFSGGEALTSNLARALLARGRELWNMYGPTEITVYATIEQVHTAEEPFGIGRPIANVQGYVLDEAMQLLPVGAVGQLYIGGIGVAGGYLGRPAQTAERFRPDPFAGPEAAGRVVYQTGDLARFLPDGRLQLLGRSDFQIKLRGHRIEPGEIENGLLRHSQVFQAVVLPYEDERGEQFLAAYVVAPAGLEAPSAAELRAHLRQRLPDYMIPAYYVNLKSLPQTPNGKIDRRALPAPAISRQGLDQAYAPPRTKTEMALTAVLAELLNMDRVGVHDDFFELGGHSLLATRYASRIRAVFHVELPLQTLFSKTTVAEIAAEIEASHSIPAAPISAQSQEDRLLPLSFAQERMWFLCRLDPDSASYHMPGSYRLRGALNIPALEESLRALLLRHEALRTVFTAPEGRPRQRILPLSEFEFDLPLLELTHLPPEEKEAAAREQLERLRARPFDLARDLMLRPMLIRLGPEEHILSIVTHHIASDGWSLSVFWSELSAAYEALAAGQSPEWAPLPLRYVDYAVWQREQFREGAYDRQLAYWRQQLDDLAPLELPADRPRPAARSYAGDAYRFTLPPAQLEALRALSRQEGVTLFMTLLAAFGLLLQRCSSQSQFGIGALIANRRRADIEGIIGFFLNTLVLRLDLSAEPTFQQLLARVRRLTLDAYEQQEVPFEKLLQEIVPERHLSRTPLFQVLMVLQNTPGAELELPGLAVEAVQLTGQASDLDLALFLTESGEGLQCQFKYSTELFDAATIRRLAARLAVLLDDIVSRPELPIGRLTLLPAAERRLLLDEWNRTAVDFPAANLLAQFYARAAAAPGSVAFFNDHDRLTFDELNRRSNRLAHYLRAQGARPGARIGVCIERSLDAPVVLLAIFKLDAVFVPLDPGYPAERLRFMMEDSAVSAVITRRRWLAQLAVDGGAPRFFCLDELAEELKRQPADDLHPALQPEQPAYIIYTSGSTGQPKGVVVPQRQILNRLHWMWRRYPFALGEVGCQKTALNFVDSLWELLGYLLQGVPALIVTDEDVRDPRRLVDSLAAHSVSRLWLVPSLLRAILDTHPDLEQRLPRLKFWVSSGEPLPTALYERFRQALPGATLYNLYGTSEVWDVTWFDPEEEQAGWQGVSVPIGRPIDNMRTFILDRQGQPAPLGVPGELYVGGVGLAGGYVNRPKLTAARFTAPPGEIGAGGSGRQPGDRLYRSGDLARWLADGSIEFLGRADDQVKLRGYRIELGEIEARLDRHPAVRQAVAAVHAPGTDGERLLAYYVPLAGQAPAAEALSRFLAVHLPEYMVPARFIPIDMLPLTPSGKVDRRALPAPEAQPRDLTGGYAPPRNALEEKLAAIWGEILELEQVGIHDSFFALGGHSLLGVRLFARIEAEFDRRLPLALLFSAQTIALLAGHLEEIEPEAAWDTLVPIQPEGSRAPFFCVHGFGGGVLGYADLARELGRKRPFYGLQAAGLDGREAADGTIEAMAARYLAAVRQVQPHGPYYLGGYCLGGVVAFEMARQLEAVGEEAALVAIMEGFAPRRWRRRESALSPRRWLTVWRSMPYWLADYWRLGLAGVGRRARRRLRVWRKRLQRRLGTEVNYDAQDMVPDDLSGLPDHHRRLMESQVLALRDYAPNPIEGRLTLFIARQRTVSQVLFGSGDPEHGWHALARGGIELQHAAGSHHNIHLSPHAGSLAAALEEALGQGSSA